MAPRITTNCRPISRRNGNTFICLSPTIVEDHAHSTTLDCSSKIISERCTSRVRSILQFGFLHLSPQVIPAPCTPTPDDPTPVHQSISPTVPRDYLHKLVAARNLGPADIIVSYLIRSLTQSIVLPQGSWLPHTIISEPRSHDNSHPIRYPNPPKESTLLPKTRGG